MRKLGLSGNSQVYRNLLSRFDIAAQAGYRSPDRGNRNVNTEAGDTPLRSLPGMVRSVQRLAISKWRSPWSHTCTMSIRVRPRMLATLSLAANVRSNGSAATGAVRASNRAGVTVSFRWSGLPILRIRSRANNGPPLRSRYDRARERAR